MSDVENSGKPRVYISVIFCESVIRDSNDLLTAIRINEGFQLHPYNIQLRLPDGTLDERSHLITPPLRVGAVVRIFSEAPTEVIFKVNGVRPSGAPLHSSAIGPTQIKVGGGAKGQTFNISLRIGTIEEGDYWFEFYLDDVLATKAPMRLALDLPMPLQEVSQMDGESATNELSTSPANLQT